MSGIDLSDVRVRFGSPKPAQLKAEAFARGAEIHLAPGREHRLAHEAWHTVQQKQGRVRPTLKVRGVSMNTDAALEREADEKGAEALREQGAPVSGTGLRRAGATEGVVQGALSAADRDNLAAFEFGGGVPTAAQLAAMSGFFDSPAEITWVTTQFGLASYDQIHQLCQQGFSMADLQLLVGAQNGMTLAHVQFLAGLPGHPNMQDVLQLLPLPQSGGGANLAALLQIGWSVADIVAMANTHVGGHGPTLAEMQAVGAHAWADLDWAIGAFQLGSFHDLDQLCQQGFGFADLRQLAGAHAWMTLGHVQFLAGLPGHPAMHDLVQLLALPQVIDGDDLQQVLRLGWPTADVVALSAYNPGGHTPTLPQMAGLRGFTWAEVQRLVTGPNQFTSWDALTHGATIRRAPAAGDVSAETVDAMAALGTSEEKRNVAGDLDRSRSCWSWATHGFEAAYVPESAIFSYFALRTNYPPVYRAAYTPAAAVDYLAGGGPGPIRAFLVGHQVALEAVIAQWVGGAGPARNLAAQRALMEFQLTRSGFVVLPAGAPSEFHVCMHERQANVSWEHWWIKTTAGGVVETFPYRATDGAGEFLEFHRGQHNMGNLAHDFRHEVPVQGLLPAQQAILRRALTNKKAQIDQEAQPPAGH